MARGDLRKKYLAKKDGIDPAGKLWGKEHLRRVRRIQEHAVYAGMVEAMDQAVGHVLTALQRLKLAEQTVVIFMSDNGGLSTSEGHPTSNLPLRGGKGWMYEGGIREPMIVRWPGVTAPGSLCKHPVTSTAFFPTMLEMAGLPARPDQHRDGMSFVSLLQGGIRQRGPIYWHYPHYGNQGGAQSGAVRDGRWKLIEWYEDDRVELFDLHGDVGELRDRAAAQPERGKAMQASLHAWLKDTGAVMPARNAKFDATKREGR